MTCQRCGRESGAAPFCTWCGARQGGTDQVIAGRRAERFAAHPNEAVVYPAVLTTLFPHLGSRQINEFRWALVIGSVIVVVLYLAGLIAAAILAGTVLVPVLYVLYLYEVRIYRDAPVQVLGLSLGGGLVLGVLVTLIVNAFATTTALVQSTPFGLVVDIGGLAVFAVLVPAIIEAVKPLPAMLLRRSGQFPETIDGLVFGVAAGLGFAASETVIQLSSVIASGTVQSTPGNWIFPLATITILMPLLHGSATGLITAALWQVRKRPLGALTALAIISAFAGHIAFVLGTELLSGSGSNPIVPIFWQVLVVAALLIVVRVVLHRALLDEAADLGLSNIVCSNCDSHASAAGFCPVCGMAVAAMSREGKAKKSPSAEEMPI